MIIFEGLHPYYLKRQRDLFDLRIFIRPNKLLQTHWKVLRDVYERGHAKENVLEQIAKREKDSEMYIDGQSEFADLEVIPELKNDIAELGSPAESINVRYKIRLPNSISLEALLDKTLVKNILIKSHDYIDSDRQELVIDGEASAELISEIAKDLLGGLEEIGIDLPVWPSDSFGGVVLLITYLIFQEVDYEKEQFT